MVNRMPQSNSTAMMKLVIVRAGVEPLIYQGAREDVVLSDRFVKFRDVETGNVRIVQWGAHDVADMTFWKHVEGA